MKAKKLLSAAITAAMCLNLFAGTGFALENQQAADITDAGQVSDGSELESPAGDPQTADASDAGQVSGGSELESPAGEK